MKFLNSLATRGGAIAILTFLSVMGFFITLHLIHHHEEDSMIAGSLITTVSGFTSALLIVLKGSSDSTATTTTSPTGETTSKVSTGDASAAVQQDTKVEPKK